jgi:hypothetical protein
VKFTLFPFAIAFDYEIEIPKMWPKVLKRAKLILPKLGENIGNLS